MPSLLSLDGQVVDTVPAELALCPFGVFTTCVVVDGGLLAWGEHRARLAHDARSLWGHELDDARLRSIVGAHAARLTGPATMRITLYPEMLSVASPAQARGCRILVSSEPVDVPLGPRSDFRVRTTEYARESADLKSTALLGPMRLRREAQLEGYDDVLFRRGREVLEGATWTVLVWRDGEVATPVDGVLRSITAEQLGVVAAGLGWTLRRRAVGLDELMEAELVSAVNVNHPARAIRELDGTALAPDDSLLAAIAAAYAALPRDPVA